MGTNARFRDREANERPGGVGASNASPNPEDSRWMPNGACDGLFWCGCGVKCVGGGAVGGSGGNDIRRRFGSG